VRAAPRLVSNVGFTKANYGDIQRGLLGFVTCTFNNVLLIDGVTVRRRRDGRIVLSWPARTDGAGRKHPILLPIDDAARRAIEREILVQLNVDLHAGGEEGGR
jgi:DNA-binding cell septation regulator SpoVG